MDLILLLKQLFHWRPLVDILLITAGLFFVYRTLQRLGTWGIAAGMLIAAAVYLLASLLDLKGIEWILGNLSQVALIALIIIFQPELRKIFERAASAWRLKKAGAGEEISTILVEALWLLAEKRQGAIMVFPGREPLREWLSGGYELDAKPSLPLIMSIFDPSSAGHDGAMIVSGGRFTRFGVRLPVSKSARLNEEYGTRHHAGMGLSEQCDALVVVVSEERGKISGFKEGVMTPLGDRQQLVDVIIKHWSEAAALPIDLPKARTRWLTIAQVSISLALAVFFWSTLIISQGEMLEKVVTVPVECTASPPHLGRVGDKDKKVRLHLSGVRSDLDDIGPEDLSVKIDLSKTSAGGQTFGITAENLRLPRNVNLVDVVPSSIELTLAEIIEQEISIEPQLVGKLPGNMKILSLDVLPAKVKVLSPTDLRKDKALKLLTTPIYLDSVHKDASIFCKIIAPPTIQPADKRWPDVEVVIKVGY